MSQVIGMEQAGPGEAPKGFQYAHCWDCMRPFLRKDHALGSPVRRCEDCKKLRAKTTAAAWRQNNISSLARYDQVKRSQVKKSSRKTVAQQMDEVADPSIHGAIKVWQTMFKMC